MIGAGSALQMGCALGAATILSVGPTNLTVLREGLTRGRIWLVIGLFSLVNTGFMLSAYLVADVLEQLDPTVQDVMSWVGVAVILYFAFKAFRAASRSRPQALAVESRETALVCARRVLPVMLLNPLAILEMFFLPAAIFPTFVTPRGPFDFIAGAMVVSFIGFCAYGFGGQMISEFISRSGTLRLFDRACGVILSGVAMVLTVSLLS